MFPIYFRAEPFEGNRLGLAEAWLLNVWRSRTEKSAFHFQKLPFYLFFVRNGYI
jgi:hypothetical protein